MMEVRSRKINRDKLSKLTGGDHETIKFLEQTQNDAAVAVGGANDAMSAATAAQEAAEQAAQDAAAAQFTANEAILDAAFAQGTADAAQADATQALADAATAQSTADSALALAEAIEDDYVSKTDPDPQAVVSTFEAASYVVAGLQVVGPRIIGWTAATGTPYYGAFNGNTTYAAGVVYLQAEAAAVASGLLEARQRIIALEKAMRDHGLIN